MADPQRSAGAGGGPARQAIPIPVSGSRDARSQPPSAVQSPASASSRHLTQPQLGLQQAQSPQTSYLHQHQQQQQQHSPAQGYPDLQAVSAALPLPAIPLDPSSSHAQQSQKEQAATKQNLKSWWGKFTKQQQQQQQGGQAPGSSRSDTSPTSTSGYKGVFGVPLTESLKYAGVAISMVGPDGVSKVYGYIPIVVAKCGLYLKQKAVTVEGVFRISGSNRRMKELQDIFDKPPTYGRDVVWGPWSVHDAANVLRRYLNQMPEPVVPAELYDEFRNALPPLDRVRDPQAIQASIERYKALIARLPSSSKYLLSYVLDLLNVFARNHEANLMPASNLAVVFQPGLIRAPYDGPRDVPGTSIPGSAVVGGSGENLSPPTVPAMSRSMSNTGTPQAAGMQLNLSDSSSGGQAQNTELQRRQDEIKINQEVLEFLINHQDHFVVLPDKTKPIVPPAPTAPGANPTRQTSETGRPLAGSSGTSTSRDPPGVSRPSNAPPLIATPSASAQSGGQTRQSAQAARSRTASGVSGTSPTVAVHVPQPTRNPPAAASVGVCPAQPRQTPQNSPTAFTGNAAPARPSADAYHSPQSQGPVSALPFPQPVQQPYTSPPLALADPSSSRAQSKDERKDKERESRQPRKLKKGRTPTSSGVATPTRSPASPYEAHITSQSQQSYVGYRTSEPPSYAYDEDVPLSANPLRGSSVPVPAGSGATVRRSRTLPSSGATGSRQSGSRAASASAITPPQPSATVFVTTAPTPERSEPASEPGIRPTEASEAGAVAAQLQSLGKGQPAARSPDEAPPRLGMSKAKSTAASLGLRAGLPREAEEDTMKLPVPPLDQPRKESISSSSDRPRTPSSAKQASKAASTRVLGSSPGADRSIRQQEGAPLAVSSGLSRKVSSAGTRDRRPSGAGSGPLPTSNVTGWGASARLSPSLLGTSPSSSSPQLIKVKNPPLQPQSRDAQAGMSRQEVRKAAQEEADRTALAIRDAVANIGRSATPTSGKG